MNNCIVCEVIIGNEDRSISCDGCNGWCHINCGTGISARRYREILDQGVTFNWLCDNCISIRRNRTAAQLGIHTIQRDEPERQCVNPINAIVVTNDLDPVEYTIISTGSNKNKDILVDNKGYTYTKKNENSRGTTHWRCRFNNRLTLCKYKMKHLLPETSEYNSDTLQPCPVNRPHQHTCVRNLGKFILYEFNINYCIVINEIQILEFIYIIHMNVSYLCTPYTYIPYI